MTRNELDNLQEALARVQQLGTRIVAELDAQAQSTAHPSPYLAAVLDDIAQTAREKSAKAIRHQATIERLGALCEAINGEWEWSLCTPLEVSMPTTPLVYCTIDPLQGVYALEAADRLGIAWRDVGQAYNANTRHIEFTGYEGEFAVLASALDLYRDRHPAPKTEAA